ncbi:hypothetical protein GUJ93_ZPchr0003g17627 [Zizania palustris]|uniref:GH3 C-terminal domain-containing protein n=1 Tax=Zizania palustris TaxID=103762 RepID=A0A8J5VCW2_ZIZPA|nr:hypothetical protein GUJ93_ZPchr0003g17627 [Zizania palustris]
MSLQFSDRFPYAIRPTCRVSDFCFARTALLLPSSIPVSARGHGPIGPTNLGVEPDPRAEERRARRDHSTPRRRRAPATPPYDPCGDPFHGERRRGRKLGGPVARADGEHQAGGAGDRALARSRRGRGTEERPELSARRRRERVAVEAVVLAALAWPEAAVFERCSLEMEEALNAVYRQGRNGEAIGHGEAIGPLKIQVVHAGTFEEVMDYAISRGASINQYKAPRCVSFGPILGGVA